MAYHINSKGEPGICRAKMRCRFGDAGGHYNSAAEAQLAFEAAAEAEIEKSLPNHSKKIEVHSVEADPFSH